MGLRVFIPPLFPVLPEMSHLVPVGRLVFLKRRNKALGGLLRRMKLKQCCGPRKLSKRRVRMVCMLVSSIGFG